MRRQLRTVLVSMPFMGMDRPSIQLGLLAAIGTQHGFDVRTLHADLDFAARIGAPYYRALADHRGPLVGDWLFSVAAFGPEAPDPDGRLVEDLAADLAYLPGAPDEVAVRLLRTRDHDVPALLDALVDGEDWAGVDVVGFTCSFQQTVASFALARRLKDRHPHLVTVVGGANADGEMGRELLLAGQAVDLVVSGEADACFPRLLRALGDGTDPLTVPGVLGRRGGEVVGVPPEPPPTHLDALPVPDYREYFDRAERLGLLTAAGRRDVALPVETSRGCWWGAKHHCTFCGLNGTTMQYRSKSPARVLDELAELARRHRSLRFDAVDNILDMRHVRELLPALADADTGYDIFYETKANLTRAQVRALALAGVTRLQPGIESLSSHVLALMDKGVRAAQNVNLLRWASYYGIDVQWSILWGLPGETAEDYAEQAAAVPHLVHLQPPGGSGRIWLERFSPLYRDHERFGVRRREPERSYHYVYPRSVDLDRLAYFFDHDVDGELPDAAYDTLRAALTHWSDVWSAVDANGGERPMLTYRSAPGLLQVRDTRDPATSGTYTFEGALADVYRQCLARPTTTSAIHGALSPALPAAFVDQALQEFARRGLVFRDGDLAVALALPAVRGR